MFERTVNTMLTRHGIPSVYRQVITGTYDVETGSVTNTSVDFNVKIYMKHLKANQYAYPNLVGKDAAMFYLSGSAGINPLSQDLILINSKTYKVDSVQAHSAEGSILLYRIIGVAQ